MHIYVYIYMYLYMYMQTCIHIYTSIHIYIYVYTYIYVYVYVYRTCPIRPFGHAGTDLGRAAQFSLDDFDDAGLGAYSFLDLDGCLEDGEEEEDALVCIGKEFPFKTCWQ